MTSRRAGGLTETISLLIQLNSFIRVLQVINDFGNVEKMTVASTSY